MKVTTKRNLFSKVTFQNKYIYIYDVSPHLLSQHYVYFTILHPLSSQHVSAPRAIIR
jgi:hypothetical protein